MTSFRFIALLSVLLMGIGLTTSCESVKRFVSQDLEEEDFIIGKLYEDELVREVPYMPPPPKEQKHPHAKKSSAFEIARQGGHDDKLYAAIEPWMGVPYKFGGTTKQGVDCSAFVGHVFRTAYGTSLPRTVRDMQQQIPSIGRSQLQEGDLVFFVNSHGKPSHVGIYLHDGMFVHASTSNGVSISTLDNSYWNKHFLRGGRNSRKR